MTGPQPFRRMVVRSALPTGVYSLAMEGDDLKIETNPEPVARKKIAEWLRLIADKMEEET